MGLIQMMMVPFLISMPTKNNFQSGVFFFNETIKCQAINAIVFFTILEHYLLQNFSCDLEMSVFRLNHLNLT